MDSTLPTTEGSPKDTTDLDQEKTKANTSRLQSRASSRDQDRLTTPTACVLCRSKHLKCDGNPTCSRCLSEGLECHYVKSRRGHRTIGKESQLAAATHFTPKINGRALPSTEVANTNSLISPRGVSSPTLSSQIERRDPEQSHPNINGSLHERCVEGFFHYFYNSHPFLPPRKELLQFLQVNRIESLQAAILYIGSQYVVPAATSAFAMRLEAFVSEVHLLKSWSMVQTLLLFALGLDRGGNQTRAGEILAKARELALDIGMNHSEYSILNGRGSSICEESLRRTWWELYVVSILFAGLHGKASGGIDGMTNTNVPLPCEEHEFAIGSLPPLHTIDELEDDCFGDETISWSSYAYRISAARNLERIIDSGQVMFGDDPTISRKDAYITSWNLYLPASKKEFFDPDGSFDEMIFQAHLISNISTLLLHRQHSKMDYFQVSTVTSCSDVPLNSFGSELECFHASKTRQAASNITQLITLPTPLIKHTHFFICGITLASVIHLSSWSGLPPMSYDDDLKQEIRMETGALKELSRVWSTARMVLAQLTIVARKIYISRKSPVDEALWQDFIDEDIIRSLLEDGTDIESTV
ncbi:hypothetical protein BGZ60DRAFT_509359 [Tricladium varicosporioides]|nr:hypothetical protein BGZ60DRAFT_509359 [Hymenoscyphus varicosporioides]